MTAHVLLVDDSTTIRMVLAAELREAKFKVTPVPTLDGARRALAQSRERGPFHLAILDLQLPDGDGMDLLAEMRRDPEFANLPVMILSSDVRFDSRLRGLGIGADDFVGKPHSKAYLISRAQMLTGAGKRRTESPPPSFRVLIVDGDNGVRENLAKALRICHGCDVVALETVDQASQYLEYQGIAVDGAIVERRYFVRMLGLLKERCPSSIPVLLLDDTPTLRWSPKSSTKDSGASRAPLMIPRSLDPNTITEVMYQRLVEASLNPKLSTSGIIPRNIVASVKLQSS